ANAGVRSASPSRAGSPPTCPARSRKISALVADFPIPNTCEILTCAGPAPRRGAAQNDAGAVPRGAIAASRGTIVFVGAERDWNEHGTLAPTATVVDARGGAVVPGF